MRYWLTTFFVITFTSFSYSQCSTDVSICTSGTAGPFTFVEASEEVGTCQSFTNGINSANYGYILLYITESGPLSLLIEGNIDDGFIDVSIFNIPPGEDPCEAITDNGNELGCNYADEAEGCNEFGTFFDCSSQVPSPMVNAGDIIMIVIEDFSDTQNNFTLDLGPSPNAQTGPLDATINPVGIGVSTLSDPFIITAEVGGGLWTADCGECIDPNTGVFDPETSGIGTWEVCYEIGEAPCDNSDCTIVEVVCGTSAEITGNISICPGATGSLQVDLIGLGPWTFDYYLDGIYQDMVTTSENPYFLEVSEPGNYELDVIEDANCMGTTIGIGSVSTLDFPEITNVLDECSEDELTYTISFELVGGDNTSYEVVGDGTLTDNVFVSDPISTGETYVFEAMDGNLCSTSIISDAITCYCPASVEISGEPSICATNPSGVLSFDFIGEAPWTFEYAINGIDQGEITTSENPFLLEITQTGEYTISSISDSGCEGGSESSFEVGFFELPTAEISGYAEICVGGSNSFDIELTGSGPWDVEYAIDGIPFGSFTSTINSYELEVMEPGNYTITSVTDILCTNVGIGMAQLVINASPSASIEGDLIICDGSESVLIVDITGSSNFNVTYTLDGTLQDPILITDPGPQIL